MSSIAPNLVSLLVTFTKTVYCASRITRNGVPIGDHDNLESDFDFETRYRSDSGQSQFTLAGRTEGPTSVLHSTRRDVTKVSFDVFDLHRNVAL